MQKRTTYFPVFCIALSMIFMASCSTQRNTITNRTFHSISTKYNGFFNARESYREGITQLALLHEDNYENVLSVFRYGGEEAATRVAGNMDVAYRKASTAIRRHSMNIRGVEFNHWIDDCYFLIAKSHFFKRDYNLALLTFYYIIRQFDTPINSESIIWVAKTYSFAGRYDNAAAALERAARLEQDGVLDKDARLLYFMVSADFHLRRANYAQAAIFLEKAAAISENRKQRLRMTFILAQSHQRSGNFGAAQQAYSKVLDLNPDFQMEFNTRINMVLAFDNGSGNRSVIQREIERMLNDERNREFKDQIYYALGQFATRQNQTDEAIDYYLMSIENYRGNTHQKGLSFLRLGELLFERKDYLGASHKYDSVMAFISREYENIEQVSQRNAILQELASNILTINREDSLQRLASLTPAQRNQFIDDFLAGIAERERAKQEEEQARARMRQDIARRGGRPATGNAAEGGWYFYNLSAMNFGRNEFYAKWGQRELEDMWRIANRRTFDFGETSNFDTDQETGASPQGGAITRTSLLENIPSTPEKMLASNRKIAKALYNKGLIYKTRLHDNQSAIKSLETLVARFPDDENTLLSAYFLITLFEQTNNQDRANFYKNFIITRFPDTDFARILRNPEYVQQLKEKQAEGNLLYERAYNAFLAGNYQQAISLSRQTEGITISADLAAQFALLEAISYGRISSPREMRQRLTFITENFQGTKAHETATKMLELKGETEFSNLDNASVGVPQNGQPATVNNEVLQQGESIFRYNPNAVHFYVLIVDSRGIPIRDLRNQIATFNQVNHQERNLNLSTLFFGEGRQLVTITNFMNAESALTYGSELMSSENLLAFDKELITSFAISIENYPVFYQERKLEEYLRFYSITYLRN